jgi:hypothetical protein
LGLRIAKELLIRAANELRLFLWMHNQAWRRIAVSLIALLVALFVWHFWSQFTAHLDRLEKSTIPELAIGIGAAIAGIIAISFSLSLFAIQQVANYGTPAMLRAYARDKALVATYWALSVFAIVCFSASLFKGHRAPAVLVLLCLLLMSFFLLSRHFERVVRFSDPQYTIARLFKRGNGQIDGLTAYMDHCTAALGKVKAP